MHKLSNNENVTNLDHVLCYSDCWQQQIHSYGRRNDFFLQWFRLPWQQCPFCRLSLMTTSDCWTGNLVTLSSERKLVRSGCRALKGKRFSRPFAKTDFVFAGSRFLFSLEEVIFTVAKNSFEYYFRSTFGRPPECVSSYFTSLLIHNFLSLFPHKTDKGFHSSSHSHMCSNPGLWKI